LLNNDDNCLEKEFEICKQAEITRLQQNIKSCSQICNDLIKANLAFNRQLAIPVSLPYTNEQQEAIMQIIFAITQNQKQICVYNTTIYNYKVRLLELTNTFTLD
jgi:hypothetical protein